jgi:hypothetical protein
MNEQNLHSRVEGGCSRGSLSNGDIIAIIGIFASIVAAIFGVWLLEKLRKSFRGSAAVRTNFLFI